MRTFSFEAGMVTLFERRVLALRMRVRRSATGSVIMGRALPGSLAHAGDLAEQRLLAQADAADAELAIDGAGTAAERAAAHRARAELRLLLGLDDQTLLRHDGDL